MEEYDYLFKVIVLGDGGAGKTALTVRFAQGYFQESYKMTVGVDFSVKLIQVGDKRTKLQVWDTGGQERFSFVRPLYYKGAMGALLVFDVSNRESFDHLTNWMEELESNTNPVPYVLVGNKIDLPNRAVSAQEAWQFCQNFNIQYYYETSAKTGEEVGDCFHALAYAMMGVPMSKSAYPQVMKALGLAGTAPAPVAAPSVAPVPASPAMDSFGAADEYGDFDDTPAPAPLPVSKPVPVVAKPLPRPQAPVAPAAQAIPAVQPLPRPQPQPQVQPLPQARPQPKPQPVAVPAVQPLPKPTPAAVPRVESLPKPTPVSLARPGGGGRPASLGLFQQSNAQPLDVPPVDMPELPQAQPRQEPAPAPQPRVVPVTPKPIPVTPKPVSQAIPFGSPGPAVAVAQPQSQPQPQPQPQPQRAQASSGPVIFDKGTGGQQALSTASSTTTTAASSAFSFAQALSAKAKAGGGMTTSKAGFIPFSAGFTAKGGAGAASTGGKAGAIGFFIQSAVPDDVTNLKKAKKKKKQDASAGGAAAGGASMDADIVKCPGCGYSVSSKAKFCNKCGTKMK